MDDIKLIKWVLVLQLVMNSLFVLAPLLIVAAVLAAPLPSTEKPKISLIAECTKMQIDNNTYATWACNPENKDNIVIVSHRPPFTLTYSYDDALRFRFFLDRCRDGDACPDYEIEKNVGNPECYHRAVDERLRDLVKLCFDRYWFFKSFEAGPLKLNYRGLVQLHRALIGHTQSVFMYGIWKEHGMLVGEYPGVPTKQHPALGPVTGQLSPDFGSYPQDKDLK